MKKKLISCILLFCMLVTLNVLLFCVDKKSYKYELNSLNNSISVMVYDEDEEDYIKQNTIPIGDYILNEERSYCEGKGNIISYDSELGIVTTKLQEPGLCMFYFDAGILDAIFTYQNKEETYVVPKTGKYKIEAWGASGGNANETYIGGYGAYSTGVITLTKGTVLYINVGGQGTNCGISATCNATYNGGGDGKGYTESNSVAASGGGASSVALVSGKLSTLSSHASDNKILIIASGGGGGHYTNSSNYGIGGHGGGIKGNGPTNLGPDNSSSNGHRVSNPGTQSSGGCTNSSTVCGGFGYGGNSSSYTSLHNGAGSGGGGGYYGGAGANIGPGSGGSGYIANNDLKDKKMVCYSCTTSTAENTYTVSNTCVNETAISDCSKTGNGQILISYVGPDYDTEFTYQNNEETWTVPATGKYKLEVWGASGGNANATYIGGYGAYSTGEVILKKGTVLYINVGGQGTSCSTNNTCKSSYNGGGDGKAYTDSTSVAASGGGATSVALVSGELKNISSHANDNQIIIVAAGGGGGHYTNSVNLGYGGHGGGISGVNAYNLGNDNNNVGYRYPNPASQSGGGCTNSSSNCGGFGYGGNASSYTALHDGAGSGGGGGYYGGSGANIGPGAGGSSYIANANLSNKKMVCYSCTPNSNESTKTETTSCVNANATTDCSKTGNGYAKISFISSITENIAYYLETNKPAGYRGSSHTDSATQNLYRYTGSYQTSDSGYASNVDNYICLGSTDATCPADNMYRIIGVVAEDDSTTGLKAGMVKVIKNTSIGLYNWDGGTTTTDTNGNVNSTNYRSTWTCTSTNYSSGSSCFPAWNDTYLNTNILNGTYLNNISFKNKIASVKWHCYVNRLSITAADEYNGAICSNTSSKISLMYSGDYLNSYNNGTNSSSSTYKGWLLNCTDSTNSGDSIDQKWSCKQWTMANDSFDYNSSTYVTWNAWGLNHEGTIQRECYFGYNSGFYALAFATRPVFFLNNKVKVTSGTGTYSDPFRIN